MVNKASMRSRRVSPMPMRIPVVKGTACAPARAIMSMRTAGTLLAQPKCGPPFWPSRTALVSSMMPLRGG